MTLVNSEEIKMYDRTKEKKKAALKKWTEIEDALEKLFYKVTSHCGYCNL